MAEDYQLDKTFLYLYLLLYLDLVWNKDIRSKNILYIQSFRFKYISISIYLSIYLFIYTETERQIDR